MDLNERKLKILQAIVSDFITTSEPVGSRTLSKRPDIDLSPATIRNEMSDLEEMGFIIQPHTSAGRVPTYSGFRLYVDSLMQTDPLSDEEKAKLDECAKILKESLGDYEGEKKQEEKEKSSKKKSKKKKD